MKKLVLVAFLCLVCFGLGKAEAGMAVTPGAEVSVVWDREVSLDNTMTEGEMDLQWYLATFDIEVSDWLTITPKVGGVMQSFDTDQYLGVNIEAESDMGFAVGAEVQADVYTVKDVDSTIDGLTLSIVGEYLYGQTEVDTLDLGGLVLENPVRNDINLHQVELGAQISKQFGMITPRFGICYSDLLGEYDFNLSVLNLNEDFDSDNNFGLRLGILAQPTENISIDLEGQLVDQYGITVAGKIRF